MGGTSFSPLAFIAVFGAMRFLALRERDRKENDAGRPRARRAGLLPVRHYQLATDEPEVFGALVRISVAVLGIELVYFGGERLDDGVECADGRICTALAQPNGLNPEVLRLRTRVRDG